MTEPSLRTRRALERAIGMRLEPSRKRSSLRALVESWVRWNLPRHEGLFEWCIAPDIEVVRYLSIRTTRWRVTLERRRTLGHRFRCGADASGNGCSCELGLQVHDAV